MENNKNVIIDNTNLKIKDVNLLTKLVAEHADVSFNVFDVPKETLLIRDKNREKSVGEEVIEIHWKNFINIKKNFNFKPIKRKK